MSSKRITVLTPVYNRKHTIHRAFDSLMRQTFHEFEWLVIDDGSTDGIQEIIDDYKKTAFFPVSYYYKENGGKHTAINMAYQLMKTEYYVILDSDDALADNALERMLFHWDSIPEEKKQDYWCVVGLCADSKDLSIVGDKFPEGINSSENPRLSAKSVSGEKQGCLRLDISKKYPFPEPPGTTFITECIVWNKIDKDYKQYYVNDIFRIYYMDEPDSLTLAWYKNHVGEGYVSNFYWKLSTLNDVGVTRISDLRLFLEVAYYGAMAGRRSGEILKSIEKKKYRAAEVLFILPAKLLKATRGKRQLQKLK